MSFKKWLRHVAAGLAVACMCTGAYAVNDPVAVWTFEPDPFPENVTGSTGPSVSPSTGTGNLFGWHASASTAWSTPAGNGSANAYSSNNWAVGDYYEFTTSTLGYADIGVTFDYMGSGTGPRDFQLSYSLDGSSFTDFGSSYQVQNAWSTAQFDLTSISALDNQANVYFRLTNTTTTSVNGATVAGGGTSRIDNVSVLSNFGAVQPPTPRLPEPGDIVFGLNNSSPTATLELVSGPATANGGTASLGPWSSTGFMQSVEFDNYNGILHNARGNLLALDFGGSFSQGTGLIYSHATNGSVPVPAPQMIGNTAAGPNNIGQVGNLTLSRLTSLSVSPDNTKIAVMGYDSGSLIVYDYTPGDTMGSGAALASGRETNPGAIYATGSTQGTAWLNSSTVITFSSSGDIFEVDAATMAPTYQRTQAIPALGGGFTALAYNPEVSDYLYATYSGFLSELSQNVLYILDPANSYALVHEIDLNTSLGTDSAREIALDANGNLFLGTYGSEIHLIPAAALAAGTDNSSVLYYTSPTFSSHNGLDIAFGESTPSLEGDYNQNGTVDAADYVLWRKNPSAYGGPGGYTTWKTNFGDTASPGGGGAVPEPASIAMVVLGCVAAFGVRRRSA